MTTRPVVPTVSIRGTSLDELIRQNRAAANAIREAIEAMSAAAPNGRDFTPRDLAVAIQDHARRVSALAAIQREYEDIIDGLIDQWGRRL